MVGQGRQHYNSSSTLFCLPLNSFKQEKKVSGSLTFKSINLFSVCSHGTNLVMLISKAQVSAHTQKCSPRAYPDVPAPYPAQEPAPRVIPVWHKTGREESCLFCNSLELEGCTSNPSALSTELFHPHPQCCTSLSKSWRKHCIFPFFSTQMAAQSCRARMKIKPPLQKVTQDNKLQPSSHALSVQSFSEAYNPNAAVLHQPECPGPPNPQPRAALIPEQAARGKGAD